MALYMIFKTGRNLALWLLGAHSAKAYESTSGYFSNILFRQLKGAGK